MAQVTGPVTVVSHHSSLIWFDNLPKNFSKSTLTSAIYLQEFELNKDLSTYPKYSLMIII